ncbi:hypothetical protein IEQ34_015070 [Dendrobium chrysotoxum]|uniref:Uncharacterized protein n=1 Tax=Dendrobium chrysotoxum TaxID=161865 RepID=A0AAV7GND2_DENCH|nr:hypothetical protein IEQ34_015070 [Dendrobium chrysotoxum]
MEGCLRKGPWLAEEDVVLMEYVKTYGPHDWSSIRSKGLLPRTGKSCRLRWVNKLKPNLKTLLNARRPERISAMEAGCIRKGPWLAEEDAVLMDYVKTYGPRDWSSIRSKGLLPRTGKSCRLRWVNKLKPNLKTGCKFSEEEEGIVIDMQSRIGNKWARIATLLPGRTDNDVKNFWSTRQKRLARLLNTPLPARSRRNQGKVPVNAEMPNFEPNANSGELPHNDHGCQDIIQFAEEYQNSQCFHAPYVVDADDMQTVQLPYLDESLPLPETAIIDYDLCLHSNHAPPHPPYDHLLLDLPQLLEGQDVLPEFNDLSLPCNFVCAESSQAMQLPLAPTFSDLEVGDHVVKIEHPGSLDSSFGEFPAHDMFECQD